MQVGIDMVEVTKFHAIEQEDYAHWGHVFTEDEWAEAFRDGSFAEHLAGTFAAKEAAMKATGKVGVKNLLTFMVTHEPDGAPQINIENATMSISHNQQMAVAVVIVP